MEQTGQQGTPRPKASGVTQARRLFATQWKIAPAHSFFREDCKHFRLGWSSKSWRWGGQLVRQWQQWTAGLSDLPQSSIAPLLRLGFHLVSISRSPQIRPSIMSISCIGFCRSPHIQPGSHAGCPRGVGRHVTFKGPAPGQAPCQPMEFSQCNTQTSFSCRTCSEPWRAITSRSEAGCTQAGTTPSCYSVHEGR